jgi:hypothetical protein
LHVDDFGCRRPNNGQGYGLVTSWENQTTERGRLGSFPRDVNICTNGKVPRYSERVGRAKYLIIPQINDSLNNSNCQLPFPFNPHIGWTRISNLWLQELQLPKWSLHSLMYKYTFNFLQNFCGYASCMTSSCSHVASSGSYQVIEPLPSRWISS